MRFRPTLGAGLLIALGATSTSSAHAAFSDDIRRGTEIYFRSGHITLEGSRYHETDWRLPKSTGTLSTAVNARSLGLDVDMTIHLTGSVDGAFVVWTFDETLPEPIEVQWATHLNRVRGRLVGRLDRVADDTVPGCTTGTCPFSVRVRNSGASWIVLSGSGPLWTSWSRTVTNLSFDLLAGVPRPVLRDLNVNVPIRLCQQNRDRYYAGRVRITNPAPSGGGTVEVTSNQPTVLETRRVPIAGARTEGSFLMRVPSGFSGDVVVTASAGGAMSNQLVSVRPATECFKLPYYVRRELLSPVQFPCQTCIDRIRLANDGGASVRYDGKWFLVDEKGSAYSADEVVGVEVEDIIPSFYAELWGVQHVPKSEPVPFRLSLDTGELKTFPNLVLAGTNDTGVAFGALSGKPEGAGFFNGSELFTLGLGAGSRVTASSTNTVMAGVYPSKTGQRGFADFAGQLVDLGSFGLDTQVTGVSEAGDVVGWSLDEKQQEHAFLFSTDTWKMQPVASLPNFPRSQAVGVSDNGWIFANAISADGKTLRPYLYSNATGAVDLHNLLADPKLVPLEALSISGGGELVVRMLVEGKPAVIALTPKLD